MGLVAKTATLQDDDAREFLTGAVKTYQMWLKCQSLGNKLPNWPVHKLPFIRAEIKIGQFLNLNLNLNFLAVSKTFLETWYSLMHSM